MADRLTLAADALEALGFALFCRADDGALRLAIAPAKWLTELWPELSAADAVLPLERASPFLENFFVDAAECWRAGGDERVTSGPWLEHDLEMEATAFTAGGTSLLLIERLGQKFAEKKSVLQKARETVLAYQRLNSEIQKKQVLLHFIAQEMNAALANAITSLRLMELQDNPARTRTLLGLASRATDEQQELIHKVLRVFAGEVTQLFGDPDEVAELNRIAARAVEGMQSRAAEAGVTLVSSERSGNEARISGDPEQIERAIVNLIEMAIEQTRSGGTIALSVVDEDEFLTLRISDDGTKMSPEIAEHLFAEDIVPDLPPSLALRAQFSRMVIARSEGELFYKPSESGGNSFIARWRK